MTTKSSGTPALDFLFAAQTKQVLHKIASAPRHDIRPLLKKIAAQLKHAEEEEEVLPTRGTAIKNLTTKKDFKKIKTAAAPPSPAMGAGGGATANPFALPADKPAGPDLDLGGPPPAMKIPRSKGVGSPMPAPAGVDDPAPPLSSGPQNTEDGPVTSSGPLSGGALASADPGAGAAGAQVPGEDYTDPSSLMGMLSGASGAISGAGGRAADALGLGDAFNSMPEWGQTATTLAVPAGGLLALQQILKRRKPKSSDDEEDDEEG